MQWMSVVAMALSVLVVGPASAAEPQARAQVVDSTDRPIVLQDGTKLWLTEEPIVRHLQEGITVSLSYEERDGRQIVTRIETAE